MMYLKTIVMLIIIATIAMITNGDEKPQAQ